MARSKADKLAEIHSRAIREFDDVYKAVREERLQAYEDRRFCTVAGAQWEGPLGEQFDDKPRLEFNKVHLAVIRIINEYRANRVMVDFVPKDGAEADELADALDGLYRADAKYCAAQEAKDNAFEEAVQGGMGAWRICSEYEDDEDEDDDRQRISIKPIYDADISVFFDLGSKLKDKSDAERCWVLCPMPVAEYRAEYGDDPTTWPKYEPGLNFDWYTADIVWLAEYYETEETKEVINWFESLDGETKKVSQQELEDNPEMLDELTATGWTLTKTRKVEKKRIHKYIMSGSKVVEDCGYIPGCHIPIVVTYGKRWVVNGIERLMGHVRLAKDPQRLLNAMMSWLADQAGRFDMEKPYFTPEQIAGHEQMHSEDSIRRYPYLLVNPVTDENGQRIPSGPIGYTRAPQIPPAMAALAQVSDQSLAAILGNQQAGEEITPNISGKAVELVQNKLDMQSFIYLDHFAQAEKRSGEIWLSQMRDIAVEEGRKMKAIGPNDETTQVVLNAPGYNKDTGETYLKNDIARAKYAVTVDVGPASSSKRAATVRALTGMMQMTADPETQQILSALSMMNMEGEGVGDVRQFYRRKLVKMGVVKPTEQEMQEMQAEAQGQQPDPQSQYLMAAAEEAATAAQQNRAKVVDTIASAELKRAQSAKTLAETSASINDQQLASANALRNILAVEQPGIAQTANNPGQLGLA